MLRAMVNGQSIPIDQPGLLGHDRGLLYGDGLFETMLLRANKIRFLEDHWQRLQDGCVRLHFPAPNLSELQHELQTLCAEHSEAIVKVILTRGADGRGYRPSDNAQPTRVWQLFTVPTVTASEGIVVRWCVTRVARNPLLAGMKHCNRLEQVLAQAEWRDPEIAEGLMLDTEGELVGGTMSNVFLVFDGALVTPDLRYAGIAGVMRRNVFRMATNLGLVCEERSVHADEVAEADELFVCNAVRGIQPVRQLERRQWRIGRVTQQLVAELRTC